MSNTPTKVYAVLVNEKRVLLGRHTTVEEQHALMAIAEQAVAKARGLPEMTNPMEIHQYCPLACSSCGAWVWDLEVHARWHDQL